MHTERDTHENCTLKILRIEDRVVKDNVTETLGKNFTWGIEEGLVMYGTRRVSRMVSVCAGMDDEVKGVPIKAVTNEISVLASGVRETFPVTTGPVEKMAQESDAFASEYSCCVRCAVTLWPVSRTLASISGSIRCSVEAATPHSGGAADVPTACSFPVASTVDAAGC